MKAIASAMFVLLLLSSCVFADSEEEKVRRVLQKAAGSLGWPTTVTTDESDDIGTGKSYTISQFGGGSDDDLHGTIISFSTDQEPGFWIGFLDDNFDMDRSSYLGRDAVISRYGENCNPTGIPKMMNEWVNSFFESIFGESDDPDKGCVTEHGAIIWACGKYLFAGNDARSDEGGEEDGIAAAIYYAAQEEGMCDYGDTLVMLVDTPDVAGTQKMPHFVQLAQKVNEYYGVNSYRQYPPFKFSFMDADGSRGTDDWQHITTQMSAFRSDGNKFSSFEEEAVKKAFGGSTLAQDLYFERVVLVYSGESQQVDPNVAFYDACDWKRDADFVEVDTTTGKRKIFSKNFIFLSERRDLGTWAHEFGHSLPSKHTLPAPSDYGRMSDRYNYIGKPYGQYGEVYQWGLMGYGAWWGDGGSQPVQMSGFSKNSARWLDYTQASLNNTYTIKALEAMQKGDTILTLDDPVSGNAEWYYIMEARDPNAVFGAPELGVVVYKVRTRDGHHVVNSIDPQSGTRTANNKWGVSYHRPTLSSTSANYTDVHRKFRVVLVSQAGSSATVRIEEYRPANLTGAAAAPAGAAMAPVPGANGSVVAPPMDADAPRPDIDLHAYDAAGNHVGMDYQSGVYEREIPGAFASGDLVDDEEWIYVPEGTEVRFEVSNHDTQAFLSENPSYAAYAVPQGYDATAVWYDAQGARHEADLGSGNASAGQTIQLKSPSDPSLKYERKDVAGVGNNLPCGLGAALLSVLAALAVFRRCN